jgi:hypothetical protein
MSDKAMCRIEFLSEPGRDYEYAAFARIPVAGDMIAVDEQSYEVRLVILVNDAEAIVRVVSR